MALISSDHVQVGEQYGFEPSRIILSDLHRQDAGCMLACEGTRSILIIVKGGDKTPHRDNFTPESYVLSRNWSKRGLQVAFYPLDRPLDLPYSGCALKRRPGMATGEIH